MSDEPYTIIHLGNPYDFVIKNINEHETYGTFQGDNESMEEFIEKVNLIIKENDELKSSNEGLLKDLNYGFKLIKSVEKENDELKTELFEVRKENEQLKQENSVFEGKDAKHYQRWVNQIKKYVEETNTDFTYDDDFIIKIALSYTLQSLRNGESLKRFQWDYGS